MERLRADPRLLAEVKTARAWGAPWSVFRGRAVTEGQPQWTDMDRAYALALAEVEAGTHSCGQPISESFTAAFDGKYDVEPITCHACFALDRRRGVDADRAGLLLTVVKKQEDQ